MLGLNETIDQLDTANHVHWYCHVLRRADGHVMKMTFDIEVDGLRKNGRPKMIWKREV